MNSGLSFQVFFNVDASQTATVSQADLKTRDLLSQADWVFHGRLGLGRTIVQKLSQDRTQAVLYFGDRKTGKKKGFKELVREVAEEVACRVLKKEDFFKIFWVSRSGEGSWETGKEGLGEVFGELEGFLFGIQVSETKVLLIDLDELGDEKVIVKTDNVFDSQFFTIVGVFQSILAAQKVNRDMNLYSMLKDCYFYKHIVLIANVGGCQKNNAEDLRTLKISKKICKLALTEKQKHEFETLKESEKALQNRLKELTDKNAALEDENWLFKEIIENRMNTTDWAVSSDSEEENLDQKYSQINEEKKKPDEFCGKYKDPEEYINTISKLKEELEKNNVRILEYQEVLVHLTKQNSELEKELNKTKDSPHDLADSSNISSEETAKYDIYKILEEKEKKISDLTDQKKTLEQMLAKVQEKHLAETTKLKKRLMKARKDLQVSQSNTISQNQTALNILSTINQEKDKLTHKINLISSNSDKHLLQVTKVNEILLKNLQIKSVQISELQEKFDSFLLQYNHLSSKLESKKQKTKSLKLEIFKIKSYLSNSVLIKRKLESSSLYDIIVELVPLVRRKNRIGSVCESLNLSNY